MTANYQSTMKSKTQLLVFQHVDCEHPGSLRNFLAEDQVEWHPVNLHSGDDIPHLEDYDALWVMGGPMDVWDIDTCPWLVQEKAAIRKWVLELRKPYLGLCLGHQLLADALDGTCSPIEPSEIGILDVALTAEGKQDPLFSGIPAQHKCLQWHSVQVEQPPEHAVVLQMSEQCPVQAMRIGSNAWSMQYHIELEPDTITNWNEIPAYRNALMETLGKNGLRSMQKNADCQMPFFLEYALTIYKNFMALTCQTTVQQLKVASS